MQRIDSNMVTDDNLEFEFAGKDRQRGRLSGPHLSGIRAPICRRLMAPMRDQSWRSKLPVKRSFCRQVLDCGDGVREVTALAFAALKIPNVAADTATATQSGDSEDSVAAVQNARAPIRSAPGLSEIRQLINRKECKDRKAGNLKQCRFSPGR